MWSRTLTPHSSVSSSTDQTVMWMWCSAKISIVNNDLTIEWQNLNQPNATLAPQARQARASGENLNYLTLASQAMPSCENLNYLLSC